jgi:hypothetical protein
MIPGLHEDDPLWQAVLRAPVDDDPETEAEHAAVAAGMNGPFTPGPVVSAQIQAARHFVETVAPEMADATLGEVLEEMGGAGAMTLSTIPTLGAAVTQTDGWLRLPAGYRRIVIDECAYMPVAAQFWPVAHIHAHSQTLQMRSLPAYTRTEGRSSAIDFVYHNLRCHMYARATYWRLQPGYHTSRNLPCEHGVSTEEALAEAVVYIEKKFYTDGEPRPFGEGKIYVIQAESGGPLKVGYGKKPMARLSNLQVGRPDAIRIVDSFRGTEAVERALHRRLKPFKVRGEWFGPAESVWPDLHEMKAADAANANPIDLLEKWGVAKRGPRCDESRFAEEDGCT